MNQQWGLDWSPPLIYRYRIYSLLVNIIAIDFRKLYNGPLHLDICDQYINNEANYSPSLKCLPVGPQ